VAIQGLVFPFNELLHECEVIRSYARSFLDKTTLPVLDEAKSTLQNIQSRGPSDRTTPWEVREDRPLRTILSDRESQPNGRARHRIRGTVSFIWDIRPLDEGAWKGRRYFALDGKASTVIRLTEDVDGSNECIARWSIEVGDHQSPGTHFHSHVGGFERSPFPKSLDVPRLPALAMTPFLAIEFVIGELFQDRWRRHALADSKETRRWRNIHGPRLARFFEWQMRVASGAGIVGSPWMTLKTAKPNPDLLAPR